MNKLIQLLEEQIGSGDTSGDEISQQRERNHRYYSMQPLGNEQEGRSHYIDPSVFGSVEDKKAVYSETFLSSRQVVRFNGPDAMEAEAKTAYVQRILKDNNYEELFADGWHDAFVAKRMTVWVDWRRNREEIQLQFMGAPTQAVNEQMAQLGEIVSVDTSQLESMPIPSIGEQQYVHTGIITVEVDKSFIKLDLIRPELVFRDPEQSYARDAGWNGYREDVRRLELINRGFDPEQVMQLNPEYRWGSTNEEQAREAHAYATRSRNLLNGVLRDSQEEVSIYKTRAWLAPEEVEGQIEGFEAAPGPAIYEIYWAHGEILYWADGTPAVRIMDEMKVFEWSEFKIAHAEHGLCTADVEAHQQKASSMLKRGVMDNMNITNNPRWEANPAGIRDMRDLYENAIGGIIEVEPGMPLGQVQPLAQPQLSPMVMGVMQMLDRDSEQRSGMSDLARGLNQDAISNQNAENMIDKITSRGERRVAMGVRSFANTFLIPLLQAIVRCGMEYDKSQSVMESGGQQIMIAPSTWQDTELQMEVEVALTPKEAQEMSVKLLAMDDRLRQDPELAILYSLQNKHALYDTVFELLGIKDSTKYMSSPQSPEVQQAMQAQAEQMQQEQMRQDQLAAMQMELMGDEQARKWAEANSKIMDTIADNEREDDKFEWSKYVDQREMELEMQQRRAVSLGN